MVWWKHSKEEKNRQIWWLMEMFSDYFFLFTSYRFLKLSLSVIVFFRSWFSLMFSSVRLLITFLSSDLVTSWYFNVCCILVSHLRHSGHLDDFEVDGLMISITSISPTGLVGLFGENFVIFVWFSFGFTDCLCLVCGDEDLLLLLSSLSCFNFRVVFPDFYNDGSVYFFFSLPSSLLISLI